MGYLDSKSTGYLAWAWSTADCGSGPSLITNYYSGHPTAYGAGYRSHLLSLAGG